MTFPIDHLSASFIKAYMDCHRKGRLYKDRAPSDFDPRYAEAGSVVHSAIERFYTPTAEEYAGDPALMDGAMVARAKESIDGFKMIMRRLPRLGRGKGQRTEVEFHWHPEPDVEFLGFIDLLTVGEKVTYIDDWKTGVENPKDELQMKLYKAAIHDTMGIPMTDIIPTLHYLRSAKSKTVFGGEHVKEWLTSEVIIPIRNGDWTPNRGSHCARCEYRRACEGME